MKRWYLFFLTACIMTSLYGCVKIVRTGEEASLTGKVAFEDTLDIGGFWDSQAVAEIKDEAVELGDFLTRSNGNLASLAEEYGRYTMGDSGNLNYAVHGTGEVTAVHDDVKAGYMEIRLEGYEGDESIYIQIGPVFKKTTIRDYLSFLDVNDYTDQIQFAQLSKEINQYILEHVVEPADVDHLLGKKLSFYGCFTYDKDDILLITPVSLDGAE